MTSQPSGGGPRTLSIKRSRLIALVTLAVTPLGLASCGLLGGGDNQSKAPVVIPSESTAPETPSSPITSASVAPAPPPSSVTMTTTDVVVENRTHVVRATSTKTLPAVTVTQTPPPITLTQTDTKTIISVPPPVTVTHTTVRLATRTVTRTATRTATKTVTK